MKILVIGSGGREHALAWKISKSPQCKELYCASGNAGTAEIAENVAIEATDISGLAEFASQKKIDLTVVGPELPLSLGIVDLFQEKGLKIFGPEKKAAEIEASKVFAKQFMQRHRIPTGRARVAYSAEEANNVLNSDEFPPPLVVKADGLAAGKGVIVCQTKKEAEKAVELIMVEKQFGAAGDRVLIEEFLEGKEVSFIIITDGVKVLPLVTTMDHKPVYDGDEGPNTGGMGAISPSPFIDQKLFAEIIDMIVLPTITRMLEEGRKYKGVLYVGLMLTDEGPKVLEYNCRFGDPETQPQVLRIESDLVSTLLAALGDDVLEKEIKWSKKPSGCVVIASGGYPSKYEKGKLIKGLEEVARMPGITLFHAGTKKEGNELYTAGGRVIGVCASEGTLAGTMEHIYSAISRIRFEAMHFRSDIGAQKEEE